MSDTAREIRVLAVDDSEEFLAAVCSWIESQSTLPLRLIATASDGQAALEALDRDGVDLVLMDAFMPRMDGFAATREIKGREGAPLVIMLSVHEGSAVRNEAWAAGADAFVAKDDFVGRLADEIVRLREANVSESSADRRSAPGRALPDTLPPDSPAERRAVSPRRIDRFRRGLQALISIFRTQRRSDAVSAKLFEGGNP